MDANNTAPKDRVLRINGSVDPSTGNIQHAGDVRVTGDVCDLFELSAGGDVTVDGVIAAARLRVARNLRAAGGIAGKGRAFCAIAGSVYAKHISNANVEAHGDVVADAMVWESTVCCGGNLTVEQGPIAASRVIVAGSVTCRALGLPSAAETVVEVGVNEFLRRLATEPVVQIQQLQKRLNQLRLAAAPNMQHTKALTPREKERTMELLFEADEVQADLDARLKSLRTASQKLQAQPTANIVVAETIHPGVTFRFPRCEATMTGTFRGAMHVIVRNVGSSHQVLLLDPATNASIPLQTRPRQDPAMDELHRLLAA